MSRSPAYDRATLLCVTMCILCFDCSAEVTLLLLSMLYFNAIVSMLLFKAAVKNRFFNQRGEGNMATVLGEGRSYGLLSNCGLKSSGSSEDKTVVHVKLTDTAIKAIEEFRALKVRKVVLNFSSVF